MSDIGDLANSIFKTEFDNDYSTTNPTYISGWLFENLGQLNSLLYEDFSGSSADINIEAQSIFRELFLESYYGRKARNSLRGIDNSTSASNDSDILSIADGESSVTFVNRNEVSKVYRGLASDSRAKIVDLTAKYNIYQAQPRQVGGIEVSGIKY